MNDVHEFNDSAVQSEASNHSDFNEHAGITESPHLQYDWFYRWVMRTSPSQPWCYPIPSDTFQKFIYMALFLNGIGCKVLKFVLARHIFKSVESQINIFFG